MRQIRIVGFRLLFVALILVLVVGNAVATLRSDANLVGHVVDKEPQEHLIGFTIRLMGTSIGASTDATGHYAIYNVTPGEYTVEASCMGYRTEKRRVHLKPNETTELKFEVVPDAMLLDQVVVTGNKSEVHRRNSSSLINVVGKNTFDLVSAASLADGLNFQPGVRVENDCQNCGFTQVRINGLDGHYSQILMNSRPMFSALAGVYGLEQIPANMIDRVEVAIALICNRTRLILQSRWSIIFMLWM